MTAHRTDAAYGGPTAATREICRVALRTARVRLRRHSGIRPRPTDPERAMR